MSIPPFEEVRWNWKFDIAGDGELREKVKCKEKKRQGKVREKERRGGGRWGGGEKGMFQVSQSCPPVLLSQACFRFSLLFQRTPMRYELAK